MRAAGCAEHAAERQLSYGVVNRELDRVIE
jgi:hypothetical protein